MPPRRDLVFVGVQLALFVGLAVDPLAYSFPMPPLLRYVAWTLVGVAVLTGVTAVLQLGTNLTPWPSPKAASQLVTTGVYGWVRHPIYAALILFAFGLALATGSAGRLILAMALLALFWRKAAYEETLLRTRYPEYDAYSKRVGFLL